MKTLITAMLSVTIAFTPVAFAKKDDNPGIINQIQESKSTKNQIYFFVHSKKTQFHVLYPYNYLADGHPLKLEALEMTQQYYRLLLKRYIEFYIKYTGLNDAELEKKLKEGALSIDEVQRIVSRKNLPSLGGKDKWKRAQVIATQTKRSNVAGMPSDDVKLVGAALNEFDKNVALIQSGAIDLKKHFDSNYSEIKELMPWDIQDKANAPFSILAPDFFVLQLYGTWLNNLVDRFKTDDAKKAFYNKYPILGALHRAAVAAAPYVSTLRPTIIARPWVHEVYDFDSGKKIYDDIYPEVGINFSFNATLANKKIKDKEFFRMAIGGINGTFQSIDDLSVVLGGISYNQNIMGNDLNVKFGHIAPLSRDINNALSTKALLGKSEGFGNYFLVGRSKGILYADIPKEDPATKPAQPGIGNNMNQNNSANDDQNNKDKKLKYKKRVGNGDIMYMVNAKSSIERVGPDLSDISANLANFLGLPAPVRRIPVGGNGLSPINPVIGGGGLGPIITPPVFGYPYEDFGTMLESLPTEDRESFIEDLSDGKLYKLEFENSKEQ